MKRNIKETAKAFFSNRIIINYIWVFLGQNIGTVFSMVSMIITLRIISAYDYGALVIIQTYCLLISNLFCIRTFNGFIKFSTDAETNGDYIAIKKYVNTSILLDVGTGVIAYIAGFVLVRPITQLMDWDAEMVRYVSLYMPLCLFYPLLLGFPTGIMRKLNRFKDVNVIHAVTYGIQSIVLLITFLFKAGNLKIVVIEYAFTEILESIILLCYSIYIMQKNKNYRGFWKCGLCFNFAFLKYNISFGILSAFDQILGNVSTLLINKFVGNMATAYLKIITKVCGIISKVTNPIGQVIYPELCNWISEKKYKKALRVTFYYWLVVVALGTVMLTLLFTTYDIWIRVFDPGMTSARLQSMLYLLYSILSISFLCVHQLSYALSMMKENLILVIVFDLSYLLALIPVVRTWGIVGYLVLQIIQMLLVATLKSLLVAGKINSLDKDHNAHT